MAKIRGNDAPQTLNGTATNDEIRGEGGNDVLNGLAGADLLRGGKGNDTLDGGDGNDRLRGDAGDDVLTGGAGNDRFIFSDRGGHDTVTDFHHGEDVLFISAEGIADMTNLSITEVDGHAVVSFFANGATTAFDLLGVTAASLTASDFIFVPH